MSEYDVVIVGGGPAGMSAGIYAARGKLKTLIVEQKRQLGGQCATTQELENYPGFPETTGPALMEIFRSHCLKFGVEFQTGSVTGITVADDGFMKSVHLKEGDPIVSKTVICSTGAEPRILGIPGEKEFRGKGVSYCATCDADFYEDLDVVVVGSGNTAVEESVYLTKFVNSITMIVIHEEGTMDADKVAQEQAMENEKIKFVWSSVVDKIEGDDLVSGVQLKNIKSGELTKLECDGVFMFVGTIPQTKFLEGVVTLTKAGYVEVGTKMETSVGGIFCAGDSADKFLRQVVTAAGDGAIAAVASGGYIEEEEYWREKVIKKPGKVAALFWSPLDKVSVSLMNTLEGTLKGSKVGMATVDTYKNKFITGRYHVEKIPTLVLFEDGKEVKKMEQPSEDDLKRELTKNFI